ncbi:MAG: hypothetical protein O7D33_05660 [Chloroflexi bacterium]|nr:hypothetical protein [Chloroflexota bacterium]
MTERMWDTWLSYNLANTLELDNHFHLLGHPHGSSRPGVAIMTVCDSRGKLWYD